MGQSMCHFSTPCRFKKNKKSGNDERFKASLHALEVSKLRWLMKMDSLELTFSVLSSRSASAKHRGAPKQNAHCWRGHKFGARKQQVWRPFTSSTQLESPSVTLRCRIRKNGSLARREPRIRSELFRQEGKSECCWYVACCTRFTYRSSWERHDDARLITYTCESATMLIKKRLRRHHTCQVIEIDKRESCWFKITFHSHPSQQENLRSWVRTRWFIETDC